MKQFHFAGVLCCAALACLFISCGGDASKEKTAGDTTVTEAPANPEPAPASTIVTTPESMMITQFKVADYAKWLAGYESSDSMRKANGIHRYVVGRGVTDSNTILVAQKVDDVAKAKAFSKSPALKQAMQKHGVKSTPMFSFAIATWQDTATIASNLRARTTFSVKDWTAWLKGFEDGKQERLDNGIAARVVGHDADDDKKVMLVTAIMDTAKASAYWKSDALKKRREAGGVVTEPDRFVFRVVKRY